MLRVVGVSSELVGLWHASDIVGFVGKTRGCRGFNGTGFRAKDPVRAILWQDTTNSGFDFVRCSTFMRTDSVFRL